MADEPEPLGEDDVEALLAAAKGETPSTPAEPAGQATLDQDEVEALLDSGSDAQTAGSTTPAPSPQAPSAAGPSASDIDFLLNQAEQALQSIDQPVGDHAPEAQSFAWSDFGASPPSTDAATLDLVGDVELDLSIELGRTRMHLEEVLKLNKGAVVPLDKLAGDPVDIYVNGRLVARGEVLVLNDNFCVRVAELVVGTSALTH